MHPKFTQRMTDSELFTPRHFFNLPLADILKQVERIRAEFSLLSIGVRIVVKQEVADVAIYRSTSFMHMKGIKDISGFDDLINISQGEVLDMHVKLNNSYFAAPVDETYEMVMQGC
jgi:hypothetical protein